MNNVSSNRNNRMADKGKQDQMVEKRSVTKGKKPLFGIALLFFLLTLGLVVYYIFGAANNKLSSDTMDTLLWAQASYEEGALVNPNFYYASLLPTGLHLLMVPFVAMFGFGLTAQMFGMLAFMLLFTGSILFFFRSMRWTWTETFAAAAILLLLTMVSARMRDMFYNHILYYSQGLLYLFVGMGLLMRISDKLEKRMSKRRRGEITQYILLGLWMFLTAVNGSMSLALFSVPFIGAFVIERMLDAARPIKSNDKAWFTFAILVGATLLGLVGNWWLSRGMKTPYADGVSSFKLYADWTSQLSSLFANWVRMLVEPYGDMKIFSLGGMASALCMIVAILIFVVPIIAMRRYSYLAERGEKFVVLVYGVLSVVILFLSIFSRYGEAEWRLIPMIYLAAVVSIVYFRNNLRYSTTVAKRFSALALALLAAFALKCGYWTLTIPVQYTTNAAVARTNFLKEKGLTYGYATYWYASVSTAFSNSQVKIRPIQLSDEVFGPHRYQSNEKWYMDQPEVERYFLALTQRELDEFGSGIPQDYVEAFTYESLNVFVYDHNLF